jgi:hypothetical protein
VLEPDAARHGARLIRSPIFDGRDLAPVISDAAARVTGVRVIVPLARVRHNATPMASGTGSWGGNRMEDFEERRVVPLDEMGEDAYNYEWVTVSGQHFTASEGTDQDGNDLILVLGWDDAGEHVLWDIGLQTWDEVRFLARSQGATEAAEIIVPEEEDAISPDGP